LTYAHNGFTIIKKMIKARDLMDIRRLLSMSKYNCGFCNARHCQKGNLEDIRFGCAGFYGTILLKWNL
jgi:hypothetical protein